MKIKTLGTLKNFSTANLINLILENRGIKTKKQKEEFLNPLLSLVTLESVGIDLKEVKKAKERIKKAIKNKEQIIVFGDYDVDGICGTAILWETLNNLGANVLPYIPHRASEGYGLSFPGIKNLKSQNKNCSLIITVDNGIVANHAVSLAKEQGIDVIITDHHVVADKKPDALAIIHSTKVCGASVAWLLSRALGSKDQSHLELCAIATVADVVPLTVFNRSIVKAGIERILTTKRLGLLELFYEAGINKETSMGTYEIGHIIAPRINAMGRIELAMDSLRLLCTNNKKRARELALKLGSTNKTRQNLTIEATLDAIAKVKKTIKNKKLIFISDKNYNQGIIGLVAGRLVEEFYLPAIVISKGDKLSKASARSVMGFNIIEFIRNASDLLVDVGGHPMAAGFTIETANLTKVKEKLETLAQKLLTKELLTKEIKVDCEIPLSVISLDLFDEIKKLEPFGAGNPTPVFLSKGLTVADMQLVGQEGKHLRLFLRDEKTGTSIAAIAFGFGNKAGFKIGDKINAVYTVLADQWNGNRRLQLKIRDIF